MHSKPRLGLVELLIAVALVVAALIWAERAAWRQIRSLRAEMTVQHIGHFRSADELRAAIHGERLNVAIVPLRPGEHEANAVPLYEEPIVMFVAANHPLAGQGEVAPESLAAETMIARRSCEFLDATSRFFTRHRVRPRFALRSESDERCLRMVAAGVGITTAPMSLVIDGIVPIKVSGYDFRREIGLLIDAAWIAQPEIAQRVARTLSAIRSAAADWQEAKVDG